jgi:hypothetical protein
VLIVLIVFAHADQRFPDHGVLPPTQTWDYASSDPKCRQGAFQHDLVNVTCPYGHSSRIVSTVHRIADDGALFPSYVCPGTNCTFHEWVRLDGWDSSKAPAKDRST